MEETSTTAPRTGILVVDDRSEDLLVVDVVLASPRYDLVKVTSGAEALRHLLERDFAVVLLDVHMPIMSGFELASMIRARPRSAHTPIIFLTGAEADVGQIYRAYKAGAIDYLTNPNASDSDGDGLDDYAELMTYFTNPMQADTDGDGVLDGEEINAGTNPTDPASY